MAKDNAVDAKKAAAEAAKKKAEEAKAAAKAKAEEAKEAAKAKANEAKEAKEREAKLKAEEKAKKEADKEAEKAAKEAEKAEATKKRELAKTIGKVFRSFIARIKYMTYMDSPSSPIDGIESLGWTLSYTSTTGITYTATRGDDPGTVAYTVKKGTKVIDSGEIVCNEENLTELVKDWEI